MALQGLTHAGTRRPHWDRNTHTVCKHHPCAGTDTHTHPHTAARCQLCPHAPPSPNTPPHLGPLGDVPALPTASPPSSDPLQPTDLVQNPTTPLVQNPHKGCDKTNPERGAWRGHELQLQHREVTQTLSSPPHPAPLLWVICCFSTQFPALMSPEVLQRWHSSGQAVPVEL